MKRLVPIQKQEDIPKDFQETPIADLLLYHNAKLAYKSYEKPELLIAMCMDYRETLKMPEQFSYVIRTGGANVSQRDFDISYALAVGEVKHIALIGHTQCGMVNLVARKERFIQGLSEHAGWDAKKAEEHFEQESPKFEIGNEVDFILSEAQHLSQRYPKIKVASLLYKVEDHLLYWIDSSS